MLESREQLALFITAYIQCIYFFSAEKSQLASCVKRGAYKLFIHLRSDIEEPTQQKNGSLRCKEGKMGEIGKGIMEGEGRGSSNLKT